MSETIAGSMMSPVAECQIRDSFPWDDPQFLKQTAGLISGSLLDLSALSVEQMDDAVSPPLKLGIQFYFWKRTKIVLFADPKKYRKGI